MLDDIPAASPEGGPEEADRPVLVALTPPPAEAHRSSLVHMLATVIGRFGSPDSVFAGRIDGSGNWDVDCDRLDRTLRRAIDAARPACLMGTAFNFVHVLDRLADGGRRYGLPAGSRAMETGGYKGRSRELSRGELHARIADRFGIVPGRVVTEYGMSELSSQAYGRGGVGLRFPPWTRVRAVSPEDGSEMPEGRPGLVRVHDLANVWSVAAVETGDLGILRDGGLELLGRAGTAAPRGCSLMTA
jgi:hypothetical protein